MTVQNTNLSRRDIAVALSELLSRLADPDHPALAKKELRKHVFGRTGVMVRERFQNDPALIQFSFFMPNTREKLVRVVANVNTFNCAPKIYVLNMLKGLSDGMTAAMQHEMEQLAEKFDG